MATDPDLAAALAAAVAERDALRALCREAADHCSGGEDLAARLREAADKGAGGR